MNPVIFAVAPDEALRNALDDALRRRYGGDFEVVVAQTVDDALDRLGGLADDSASVAVVMAPMRMKETDTVAFLDAARRLHPTARRIVIIDVGDVGSAGDLGQALTLSKVDMYFGQPWASPDEELHPVVGEALRVWAA